MTQFNAVAEMNATQINRPELDQDTVIQKAAIIDSLEALAKFQPKDEVIMPHYAFAPCLMS